VHNGNEKSALVAMEGAMENDRLGDFLIGTDAPAGSGVQPNGMLRMATLLASIGGLPAEQAWCCGTGNVTKKRGLKQGILEAGRSADIVFMDRPSGSEGKNVLEAMAVGNIPGIAAVMIDGKMRTGRSRSTPPSARVPG
jgi:enamidase